LESAAGIAARLPLLDVMLSLSRLQTDLPGRIYLMTKTPKPPETDDARASDSPDADKRREKLADEAGKGLRKAVSGGDDKSEKNKPPLRTGASAALGTPAEGAVEDGEGPSPAEGTGAVPSGGKQYSDRN
jgi:hypothetical protein